MLYRFPDGSGSIHPTSRELSRELKKKFYNTQQPCSFCNSATFYTSSNKCKECARRRAAYCFELDKAGEGYSDDPEIHEALQKVASPRFIIVPMACSKAGHVGLRETESNRCYFCMQPSSRQAAKARGLRKYQPEEPCAKCGTMAMRSVANGRCEGCEALAPKAEGDGRLTPEAAMRRAAPDLIISREHARALGLKSYRTGQTCAHGHNGYRYVVSGACIRCVTGND